MEFPGPRTISRSAETTLLICVWTVVPLIAPGVIKFEIEGQCAYIKMHSELGATVAVKSIAPPPCSRPSPEPAL